MIPFQPVRASQQPSKIVTLTLELSNTRIDRGDRLRDRTETYTIGLLPEGGIERFTPAYDLFSLCCYRAMLLGSPNVIIKAMVQPGGKKLLTEPLSPQKLRGEDTVEPCEWSRRTALLYRFQTGKGKSSGRRFFGYRNSDIKSPHPWLRFQLQEVIRDPATGAPPTFANMADFRRKTQVIGPDLDPMTKSQAWSTWLWLVLHTTLYSARISEQSEANEGKYCTDAWQVDWVSFRGRFLMKKGS